MTKPHHPGPLVPMRDQPELAHLDDDMLRMWAEAHGLTLHRDHAGRLATTLEQAYELRESLDAERERQAIAEQAERDRRAAEDEIRLAPIRRKLERQQRRQDALAAINAEIPFADERYRDWDARASERGEALFAKAEPAPEPDHRTLLERLQAKGK